MTDRSQPHNSANPNPFSVTIDPTEHPDNYYYSLAMLPYPSGSGLHVGHVSNFVANDVHSRYMRMSGKHVLNPIGRDAFGLPAENYAMKMGRRASDVISESIVTFTRQLHSLDMSYDRDREVNTSTPEYYKRTQWIFAQLYKAGLVYKSTDLVNRCPDCQTVLANDQVIDGACERCGAEVEQKEHPQRFIRITDYADRLLADLETLDRPAETKKKQRDRIGRSEGAHIDFVLQREADAPTYVITDFDGVLGDTAQLWDQALTHVWDVSIEEARAFRTSFARDHDFDSLSDEQVQQRKDDIAAAADRIVEQGVPVFDGVGASLRSIPNLRLAIVTSGGKSVVNSALETLGLDADVVLDGVDSFSKVDKIQQVVDQRGVSVDDVVFLTDTRSDIHEARALLRDDQIYACTWGFDDADALRREIGGAQLITHPTNISARLQPSIRVYTTRPDTIYGATALVLSPEHGIIEQVTTADQRAAVDEYIAATQRKTLKDRQYHNDGKSGVQTGGYAINPATGEAIPIWIADYVLPNYATGSIMMVPAHDERDYEFASIHNIEIIPVIAADEADTTKQTTTTDDASFADESDVVTQGVMIGSATLDGLTTHDGAAKAAAIELVESQGRGDRAVTYKLRDRSVSRQRYWGSPIPIYYDENDQPQLIPDDELPVVLPLDIDNYHPCGVSPLGAYEDFKYYEKDGKRYRREYDTLDTFVCSSFYYLRYIDPTNNDHIIDPAYAECYTPVDFYMGGSEHSVGHLLYSRFIHKFLYDQGVVPTAEPFTKLMHQGMMLAADGSKMSKRLGNIINPDDVIEQYGVDACRTYVMFMGPIEADKSRNDEALRGVQKFLERAGRVIDKVSADHEDAPETRSLVHQTIKGRDADVIKFKFNTAIAKLMELINALTPLDTVSQRTAEQIVLMLAPFATQRAIQRWEQLGHADDVHYHALPQRDADAIMASSIDLPVQIGGKMRGTVSIQPGSSEDDVMSIVRADERFAGHLSAGEIRKIIYVQDKIINIIVG